MSEPPGPLHPEGAPAAADGAERRSRRLGFGNAVHAALERSAEDGWARPEDAELAALLAAEGARATRSWRGPASMIDGWLDSPLRAEIDAAQPRAEVPFALELGGAIVRGQIDLLVHRRRRELASSTCSAGTASRP